MKITGVEKFFVRSRGRRWIDESEKFNAVPEINHRQLQNLIFYGENCVKHSIHYDFDNMPIFLGYDIYDMKTDLFMDWETKSFLFQEVLNVPIVPLIKICKVKDLPKDLESLIGDSKYGF